MKEEEQNIAIAKILGYDFISGEHPFLTGLPRYWQGAESRRPILNYTGCLNAMHKAVSIFDYDQADEFDDHLCDICKRANDLADNPTPWRFAVTNATAAQRAEAFLRVFGKWEETE
jgi:hypothetical protein